MKVTKEWLSERLKQPDYAIVIGRALLAIYSNQTSQEQSVTGTIVRNGIGFCKPDTRIGSIGARAFKAGKLQQWCIDIWMKPAKDGLPRVCKYAAQLNNIAVAKENAKISASYNAMVNAWRDKPINKLICER